MWSVSTFIERDCFFRQSCTERATQRSLSDLTEIAKFIYATCIQCPPYRGPRANWDGCGSGSGVPMYHMGGGSLCRVACPKLSTRGGNSRLAGGIETAHSSSVCQSSMMVLLLRPVLLGTGASVAAGFSTAAAASWRTSVSFFDSSTGHPAQQWRRYALGCQNSTWQCWHRTRPISVENNNETMIKQWTYICKVNFCSELYTKSDKSTEQSWPADMSVRAWGTRCCFRTQCTALQKWNNNHATPCWFHL